MKGILALAGCIIAFAVIIAPGLQAPSPDGGIDGRAPAPPAAPGDAGDVGPAAGDAVVIARDANGHFTTRALVNGAAFPIIIDSGASLVVLRREDALAAGISVFPSEFTDSAQTAGGTVRTKRVVLSRISVGGIERRDVAAAVVDADLPVSLLGQSFLAQLGVVSIADDAMTLR